MILARRLTIDPTFPIPDEPTCGIDGDHIAPDAIVQAIAGTAGEPRA